MQYDTMPPKIIEKLVHLVPIQKLTLETVKGFLNDSKKSNFRL